MLSTTLFAALVGVAVEAARILLYYKSLTINNYLIHKDKESLVRRAEYFAASGEYVFMKVYMTTRYFIDIDIGSNDQKFTVVPDTCSFNL